MANDRECLPWRHVPRDNARPNRKSQCYSRFGFCTPFLRRPPECFLPPARIKRELRSQREQERKGEKREIETETETETEREREREKKKKKSRILEKLYRQKRKEDRDREKTREKIEKSLRVYALMITNVQ